MRHKHAEKMALYAQDATETDRPWERWEINTGSGWRQLSSESVWGCEVEYRRKPKMVERTISYPEPIRKAPDEGAVFWIVDLTDPDYVYDARWHSESHFQRLLERGLIHTTKEAAIAHAKALLEEPR